MHGTATDLNALNFAIDEANAQPAEPLIKTIIFFNARDLAYKGCKHIRNLVPEAIRHRIDFLHAGRTKRSRRKVMKDFREGESDILCATEVAGMVSEFFTVYNTTLRVLYLQGMDIPNIARVIQYMVPTSLSVWTQRSGRAGRSGNPAIVVLLVEPSVFKLRKVTKKVGEADAQDDGKEEDEEEREDCEADTGQVGGADMRYQKKVEEGMRKWTEAVECRRVVSNAYFKNPPRTIGESIFCNCNVSNHSQSSLFHVATLACSRKQLAAMIL